MRTYAFLETVVGVATDAPDLADWLDEFLQPAFGRADGADVDVRIHVGTEAAAYDAIARRRPQGDLASVACFALDREIVRHPSWTTSKRRVIADAKYGVFYVLDGCRVEVLAHPSSRLFRTAVMRVIREIATARALADPRRLQLHAAAFAVDGRGVLVAGAKASGKTTLLAYLAGAIGAEILGNDRVVVSPRGDGVAVRGIPTIVSVRPETRALLPRLFEGIAGLERPAHMTLAEAEAALAGGAAADPVARLRLSPAQLARQLGVQLCAEAEIAAIVFPSADRTPDGWAVARLAPADARTHLLASRFGLPAAKTEPTAFDRVAGAGRPTDADARAIDALAATIPCFAVHLGADGFRTPEAGRALVSAVAPGGAGA